MADKQAGKGGGARKYGQNTKKCAAYKAREANGNTPKMRRIVKALNKGHNAKVRYGTKADGTKTVAPRKKGPNQPGWFLTERGKPMKG